MECLGLPSLVQRVQKGGSGQDHEKNARPVLQGLDAPIFNIKTRFLVKTVSVLNVGAIAPGNKSGLRIVGSKYRSGGA